MTIETATYISDLNAANPGATDVIPEGDDHIRLIKSTVKTTFPNVSGAVTPTHTVINNLAAGTFPGVAVTGVTNLTMTGNLSVQGNTTVGDAAGDALTVNPNAVTWSNNPTHSGNHTYSGNVSVSGNTTLGDAAGDTITINGVTTVNATTPQFRLNESDQGADGKLWKTFSAGGTWTVTATNDADSVDRALFSATRTGNAITGLSVGNTTDKPQVSFNGSQLVTTADGRLYGSALHNNAGALTGTTNQYVGHSGTYTPTFTNVANCTLAIGSHGAWTWVRNGNSLLVGGLLDVTCGVAAGTNSTFGVSLPIGSNFTADGQCAGSAVRRASGAAFTDTGIIYADATNDRAEVNFGANGTALTQMSVHFFCVIV